MQRAFSVIPGLMSKILRDCEMTRDELLEIL